MSNPVPQWTTLKPAVLCHTYQILLPASERMTAKSARPSPSKSEASRNMFSSPASVGTASATKKSPSRNAYIVLFMIRYYTPVIACVVRIFRGEWYCLLGHDMTEQQGAKART